MITDKLGRLVLPRNRIAISELKLNEQMQSSAHLVFASVINVFNNHLIIKYESNNMIDDCFTSREFIVIPLKEKEDYIYNDLSLEIRQYSNAR